MLTVLWIVFLAILASSKIALQSTVARRELHGIDERILFNGIIFLVAALIFLPSGIGCITPGTSFYGCVIGIASIGFQLFYVLSMSNGPVSLTVMFNNFSMLIPTVASAFLFGEALKLTQMIGIILILLSFAVTVRAEKEARISAKWIVYILLTVIINGSMSLIQKLYTQTPDAALINGFVFMTYFSAVIGSAVILLLTSFRKQRIVKLKCTRRMWLFGLPAGITLGIYHLLYTQSIAAIPGVLLFPTLNGLIIIISSLFSMLFFRERLTRRQILGCLIGITAIVFMSI